MLFEEIYAHMENKDIKAKALDLGFSAAEIIGCDKIEFSFEFRKYCEENLCGKHGANYSCPPDCPTPEELSDNVKNFKEALVLQSAWEIKDFSDRERLDVAKMWHNRCMLELVKDMRAKEYRCLMAGASYCNLCKSCKKLKNEPCANPESRFSCLSAYCINVRALADSCLMNYEYKNGILFLFGCIFFDK